MKRVLFLQSYQQRRGGHITARDYFVHSMRHPELDPYVYFAPGSDLSNDVWRSVPRGRLVTEVRPADYETFFVTGRSWRLLPPDLGGAKVINPILHVRHASNPAYRRLLRRLAYRIANAPAVHEAIRPYAVGPVEVIHEAIDSDLFCSDAAKVPGSVLIYGQKNPTLARALTAALRRDGVQVTSFDTSVPQDEFAAMMARAEIYVALPNRTEGGYRPPLEAMACGCALVCSDAVGTRDYLLPEVTCLRPAYDDFDGHLAAVRRLLADDGLRSRLRTAGFETARQFSLGRQRELYYAFLERYVL